MKFSSLSLLTALLSVAMFLSPAHAQTVEPVEVSDELVASLIGGDVAAVKQFLTDNGIEFNVPLIDMDIKLNSLVETLFTNMAEGDVGEFASVVNTLSAAVTTITIESSASERARDDVLVSAISNAETILAMVYDTNKSDEFLEAVVDASYKGAAAAVTASLISNEQESGTVVDDSVMVAAVEKATSLVALIGGDAEAAIAGATQEAINEGASQAAIAQVETVLKQTYNVVSNAEETEETEESGETEESEETEGTEESGETEGTEESGETEESSTGEGESNTGEGESNTGGDVEVPEIPDEQIVSPV